MENHLAISDTQLASLRLDSTVGEGSREVLYSCDLFGHAIYKSHTSLLKAKASGVDEHELLLCPFQHLNQSHVHILHFAFQLLDLSLTKVMVFSPFRLITSNGLVDLPKSKKVKKLIGCISQHHGLSLENY